jgi:hypothetical protein
MTDPAVLATFYVLMRTRRARRAHDGRHDGVELAADLLAALLLFCINVAHLARGGAATLYQQHLASPGMHRRVVQLPRFRRPSGSSSIPVNN